MASATDSPFSGSIFDEDWASLGGSDNDFDNFCDLPDDINDILPDIGNTANGDSSGAIDPQALSRAGTPDSACSMPLFPENGAEGDNIVVGPTAQHRFDQIAGAGGVHPYYHPTIEPQRHHPFLPTPLRNQLHRRSVSEPPTGLPPAPYREAPQPEPAITFTRSGVTLGTPKIQHGNRRGSPTPSSNRPRHQNRQEPYPMQKPAPRGQERYHLRRANTQPMRPGPTSVPAGMQPPPPPPYQAPQAMMHPAFPHERMHPMHGHMSGANTPSPSPAPQELGSPLQVDPRLNGLSMQEEKKVVTIPLTVEELREMITGAVQAAVGGRSVDAEALDKKVEVEAEVEE